MLLEIILILIIGYIIGKIFEKVGLPKLLGYLFVGLFLSSFRFLVQKS